MKEPCIRVVIRDYAGVDDPERGGNFQCILHNDTSKDSMKYYPETNTVYCFGSCSRSYNPVTLLATLKGISNKEAWWELSRKYNLKPLSAEEEEWLYKLELLQKLAAESQRNLGEEHREHLHKRGLTDAVINKHQIGYLPESLLEKINLTEDDLRELGIIYFTGNGSLASNFADKIIVPVYDRNFSLISLAAWNYKGIEGEPKYAFPKDFPKPLAGDAVDGAFLVEGIFDLIIMQQAGYKVCSFLGVKPTKEQLKKIRKLKDIKILLDADVAGRKLADELIKELYPQAKIIQLPENHDPNSYYVEQGQEKFSNYLNQYCAEAKDHLDEKVEELVTLDNKRDAARFLKAEIIPLLVKLDKAEQEVVITEIAGYRKELGISKKIIRDELNQQTKELEEEPRGDETNQATILYEALKDQITLYRDSTKVVYGRFEVDNHLETHPINGDVFKRYLQLKAREVFGKIVAKDTINAVKGLLESEGFFKGETVELQNRVAKDGDAFFYDLSDEANRVVKITNQGYEIINYPKALFKREAHQIPQVEPTPDGDIKAIFLLFNKLDEKQKLLFLVFLVYSLVPAVPKIILYVQGEKGAGKSDFTKVIRQLIDPSAIDSLKEPRVEDRAVQQLQHHYVALFDNVNYMHDWFVRLCCTAVTGESDEKRKLFTDDGSVIFRFMRVAIINAINRLGINYPDFQERLQLFKLNRIPEQDRMEREEFWQIFNEIKPKVLGGMFNTLAKAMEIKPTIHLANKPRMADYAVWGCAIAIALGYSQEEFLRAYYENMEETNSEMIENHPIAHSISEFMKDRAHWKGKASELLELLDDLAIDLHIDTRQKFWPKSPSALSMRINEIASNLLDVGIKVVKGQENGSNATRFIEMKRVNIIDLPEANEPTEEKNVATYLTGNL